VAIGEKMNSLIFTVVANFFVQFHIFEDGQHTYTLLGVQNDSEYDAGIEYYISYSGKALPVDDKKKFFAKIKVECIEVLSQNESVPSMQKRSRICEAVDIQF
jgi:hypothetical protein